MCRICPIKENKVVVISYYGADFGDNGKYIVKRLLEKNPHIRILWARKAETKMAVPTGISYVKYNSPRFYFHLATSKVWIDNSRKSSAIVKRKGQFYIQTWHGGIALKRVEKDVQEHLSEYYVNSAIHDSKMIDLMLSNSTFCTQMYRRAFWYDGEILECGSPRVDILFHATGEQKEQIKNKLGIPLKRRILLYAPTFRADGNLNCYHLDFEAVRNCLEKLTGDDWVIAVRLHPNIAGRADFLQYHEHLVNATAYPDMYELLAVTDILITDYSSSMFEAGFARKPVFLFATDIDSYIKDRNFYFDLKSLPFPLAESNEELFSALQNFSRKDYEEKLDTFHASLGLKETGQASAAVAEKILEVLGKTDER